MPQVLHLLDGHSLAYKSYHALTGLTAPDGRPTGAVFGFVRILDKIIRETNPDLMAVVFDGPGPSFRKAMFVGYKATRKPMPPDLKSQMPLIHDILKARGIHVLQSGEFEADDVIATLAVTAAASGIEVVISTEDKDLKQVLREGVKIWSHGLEKFYAHPDFEAEYGIPPSKLPDLFGMTGDNSDNIPGVPGIGPKTGLELLKRFGDLETVLASTDKIKQKKTRESLAGMSDVALLSRDLARIRADMTLPVKPSDLGISGGEDGAMEIYKQLGFHSLVKLRTEDPESREYSSVFRSGLERLVSNLSESGGFAFDVETTGLDHFSSDIVGFSFSTKQGEAFYLPLLGAGLDGAASEQEALAALRPLLENPSIPKFGHNCKFDVKVLMLRGIEPAGFAFDTMIAAFLLNPGRRSLSLETLTGEVLGLTKIPISDLIGEGDSQSDLGRVDAARTREYACEDADMALRLKYALEPKIANAGLSRVLEEIEMPLVGILARMELNGILVRPEVLARLDSEIDSMLAGLRSRAVAAAGEDFNLNSPKQLQAILYEKLGLPVTKKTKTGPSTDSDVLEELAPKHPLPAILSEYRTVKKLQGTYVQALPGFINKRTGRIHASFNQAVAATGRLSCNDPNLQNIPTRSKLGARIRGAFVPADGCVFLAADYSQVELRIIAHLSGDAEMIAAFNAGEDIHATLASSIFSKPVSAVNGRDRAAAKAVNFGILYGKTAFGLSRELSIGHDEAQGFIDSYFARFAGVKAYIEEILARARSEGMVRTMSGRLRQIPDIGAGNQQRRQAAERTAVNTVVQGSAADLIKIAMIRVCKDLPQLRLDARLLLQVHDELHFEVRREQAGEAAAAVVSGMEGAWDLRVPLKAGLAVGDNWMQL